MDIIEVYEAFGLGSIPRWPAIQNRVYNMIKLCIICENCSFNEGYYISEHTNDNPSISCFYNEISVEPSLKGVLQFHKWNSFAEQCDNFTIPKELNYIKSITI